MYNFFYKYYKEVIQQRCKLKDEIHLQGRKLCKNVFPALHIGVYSPLGINSSLLRKKGLDAQESKHEVIKIVTLIKTRVMTHGHPPLKRLCHTLHSTFHHCQRSSYGVSSQYLGQSWSYALDKRKSYEPCLLYFSLPSIYQLSFKSIP